MGGKKMIYKQGVNMKMKIIKTEKIELEKKNLYIWDEGEYFHFNFFRRFKYDDIWDYTRKVCKDLYSINRSLKKYSEDEIFKLTIMKDEDYKEMMELIDILKDK
jgi:hypothetical protein